MGSMDLHATGRLLVKMLARAGISDIVLHRVPGGVYPLVVDPDHIGLWHIFKDSDNASYFSYASYFSFLLPQKVSVLEELRKSSDPAHPSQKDIFLTCATAKLARYVLELMLEQADGSDLVFYTREGRKEVFLPSARSLEEVAIWTDLNP